MTQDNTELLPVTQEDIAIALEHLGYDSVDDLHYWAENDTELRRFDELCSRFARHRLNTRPTQGHDALEKCWNAYVRPDFDAVGMQDDADLRHAFEAGFSAALTNLPSPQVEAPSEDGPSNLQKVQNATDAGLVEELSEEGAQSSDTEESDAAKVIQSLIDNYAISGANLLVWLTKEDIDKMPRVRQRVAGLPVFPPSQAEWRDWADDIACRATFRALQEAKDKVAALRTPLPADDGLVAELEALSLDVNVDVPDNYVRLRYIRFFNKLATAMRARPSGDGE